MREERGESRFCCNVYGRHFIWHDSMRPAFADGRVLLCASCPCGRCDRDCVQPCEHGKPGSAAGGSDRCAFKENEEGDSRCGEMVPVGFVCVADDYAVSVESKLLEYFLGMSKHILYVFDIDRTRIYTIYRRRKQDGRDERCV